MSCWWSLNEQTCAVPPLISPRSPSCGSFVSSKVRQLGFWLKWQTEPSMVGQDEGRGGTLDCVYLAGRPSWHWVYLKFSCCRKHFLNSPKTPTPEEFLPSLCSPRRAAFELSKRFVILSTKSTPTFTNYQHRRVTLSSYTKSFLLCFVFYKTAMVECNLSNFDVPLLYLSIYIFSILRRKTFSFSHTQMFVQLSLRGLCIVNPNLAIAWFTNKLKSSPLNLMIKLWGS